MASNTPRGVRPVLEDRHAPRHCEPIHCSVGIMAYNEEANIARAIHAVLEQRALSVRIEEVIVIASGCTDQTVSIVSEIARREPRVQLYVQDVREGKAAAVNLFLKKAVSHVVVLLSADVIPEASALGTLCHHFQNPQTGMVGGRPVPVNDPATFMGHAVHLIWRLHDGVARVHPKLGEMVAFRNVVAEIPQHSAVDEISIQAVISGLGYQLLYEPASVVYNKGPLTIKDFLQQRRRIYAGHLQVRRQQSYESSTMKVGAIAHQLVACREFGMRSFKQAIWTLGAVALEGYARILGYFDYLRDRDHHVWLMVESTKDLEGIR